MGDAVLLWWILSLLSVLFIILDWSHAPIDTTMHMAFLLVTIFMGPLGLILYILTVREPLPGTHRQYIAPLWKQAVGSTLHCVAGDSVGIIGAAVIIGLLHPVHISMILNLLIEYIAGFLVGWLIFQSLFMKDMVGGSYLMALRKMFLAEWLSMNGVMAGMIAVMVPWIRLHPAASSPHHGEFWFMMSLALIAGAILAYPLNWWMVAAHLKHGLMSTAHKTTSQQGHVNDHLEQHHHLEPGHDHHEAPMSTDMNGHRTQPKKIWYITMWSLGILATSLGAVFL
ncbi:DUF4396 domain-containing protein [Sulfobacillus thermosulfidooxidans]|uniref:DUF4396 domain-containing protein n=1 Tax=Sulfobacillus thermosulfidooxidans TaxID=28034 RepID=UPI0006B44686|nr:DUF4396 domain-containing protein [Sulfobacillus thermosulfidooxidans]